MLYQNSHNCFLKASCNVTPEIISMNTLYSLTLKPIGLSCTVNGFFTWASFCNIVLWSRGKYLFTELCRPLKCWYISWYKTFKITFWKKNTTTDLKRKVHFGRCCQAHDDKYKFSRISVFTWKIECYHWQQILSVISLGVMGWFCSVLRKCLPRT